MVVLFGEGDLSSRLLFEAVILQETLLLELVHTHFPLSHFTLLVHIRGAGVRGVVALVGGFGGVLRPLCSLSSVSERILSLSFRRGLPRTTREETTSAAASTLSVG